MTSKSALRRPLSTQFKTTWILVLLALAAVMFSPALLAQQTGEIAGRVTDASDGSAIAGVSVEATSNVLPGARASTTSANGDYRLPLLPPGNYTIKFTLSDETTRVRTTEVLLQQRSVVDLSVDFSADESTLEEVIVVGTSMLAVDTGGASIAGTISNDTFEALPVGQEYRDLMKLIPGVQVSNDSTRGPSAGGSGQDNVYQFDGVDVTLPLFGTLSAEPSTHDIDQVSIVRGGATAIGFNRAGGFKVNTSSKRGTDEFHGQVSYQLEDSSMTAKRVDPDRQYDQDREWFTGSLGGPILKDKLYFYGSYYRPTVDRSNTTNAYGEIPGYSSTRNEYFGKLTFAATENLLFDLSQRTSERDYKNANIGDFDAPTTSQGGKSEQDITIFEGSWVINDASNAYFKYTDYSLDTTDLPDTLLGFVGSQSASFDVNNPNQMGYFLVPRLTEDPAFNALAQPLIDRFGYVGDDGNLTGGGHVGAHPSINKQNFGRKAFEIGYDLTLEQGSTTHDIHVGYHQEKITEDLTRSPNGWGTVSFLGDRDGDGVYWDGDFFVGGGIIHSESKSRNIEINDAIRWKDFTFNVGVLFSQDTLYGQGLAKNPNNPSGWEIARGKKYKMHKEGFGDMIQPRLGITWDVNDRMTAFANYARYYPSASSLARAASWDRNLNPRVYVDFDESGNIIGWEEESSSRGKLFQKGIDPRHIDEYLVGVTMDFNDSLTGRAHFRYRGARNFWEDTDNDQRVWAALEMPDGWAPKEYYEPGYCDWGEIGLSCGSYIIAQLERSYTDYYEANFEIEYNLDRFYLQASYTWSKYKGNFDQDGSTSNNDDNIFIGSSFIADSRGRQLWHNKDGRLHGDRPHLLKLYGYYELDWNATVGFYTYWQSGHPWEANDARVYGYSDSYASITARNNGRYAEPAGSRRTDSHYQLDLNYTQNFYLGADNRIAVQLRADLYNVFNKQTGYNPEPAVPDADFGNPRNWYSPRRLQLTARLAF